MNMEKLTRELNLPDIEATDKYGNTALHLAVKNKAFTQNEIVEVLEILIDKGINPDSKNNKNQTVLHLAIAYRMKDVVNCLLEHKVNMDSVAHSFVEDEYITFQELFVQLETLDGWQGEILRLEIESADFTEWLITRGFDFDCRNQENESAVNMAIKHNLHHVLPVLLKYTQDINFIDKENKTLLHLFLQNNFTSTYYSAKSINKKWYDERYATNIIRILLDRGVSADAEDIYKLTPFQLAIAKKEHISIIQILIEQCSNIHRRDIANNTMFQTVIRYFLSASVLQSEYYLKILCSLIAKGADVNERYELDKYGYTALCYAVADHHMQLVNFLIENGADLTVTTKNGRNLLHLLAISTVTLKDVEVKPHDSSDSENWKTDTEDVHENGPPYELVFYGDSAMARTHDEAVIQKLIEHGVRTVYIYERSGYTSAFYTAAVRRGDISLMEMLKKDAVNFNVVTTKHQIAVYELGKLNTDGMVPFMSYCSSYIYLLQLSDENGEDFTALTKSDGNFLNLPMAGLCNSTSVKLFDLLISKGCKVNAKDMKGNTPLHEAVSRDNEAVVEKLIEHGAEVNCRSQDGTTPLHIALGKKNIRLMKLLGESGANFHAATKNGETLMHQLFKANEHVKMTDETKIRETFDLLISKGCQLNVKDKIGNSPIHLAAEYTNAAIMRVLIEHGADVNCRNNQRETPLHFATKNRKAAELGKVLLAHGANVHAKDSRGQTALHKAATESRIVNYKMLWALLKCGADVNTLDSNGLSALSYACVRDHKQMLEMECRETILRTSLMLSIGASCTDDLGTFQKDDSEFFYILEFSEYEGWRIVRKSGRVTTDTSEASSYEKSGLVASRDDRGFDDLKTCFVRHSMKLKAANMPWDPKIDSVFFDSEETKYLCEKYYEECLREVETLKNTFIDDDLTSLYVLLHVNLNRRCAFVHNEKLQKLVHSPALAKHLPKYFILILACYRDAMTRRSLLKQAREAWLELTKIALPEICTELIFSFLSNSDLFDIIEKD